MDKDALFASWRAHLQGVRDGLLGAQGQARAGTRVDGEHRPENRGERAAVTTQGYLAAGIGARLAELNAALDVLDRMAPEPRERAVTGALITLADGEGRERILAILPGGDGTAVEAVRVVSPEAPVARALWGRVEGDEVELPGSGAWEVVDVA